MLADQARGCHAVGSSPAAIFHHYDGPFSYCSRTMPDMPKENHCRVLALNIGPGGSQDCAVCAAAAAAAPSRSRSMACGTASL
jgi:hypothetical protein